MYYNTMYQQQGWSIILSELDISTEIINGQAEV